MEYVSGLDLLQKEIPEIQHINCGTKMDMVTNGFSKGEIHLISGSTKNGKSLALLHSAILCAMSGKKVCYLSLENSEIEDHRRLEEAIITYGFEDNDLINLENLYFMFLQGQDKILENYVKPSTMEDFDIIYIDGSEYLNPPGDNGADINKKGKIIIRELRKYLMESPYQPPLVISWQNNKLAIEKSISQMTVGDLGGSYAIAQVAASVWMIVKGKKNWQMKLLCARERYDDAHDTIEVRDANGNFNLLY